ncbi:MAG: hypothetical protein LBL04_09565 [Bacteroidales bacterium]|jgi:hypothetical protein|nr:hypothetical protein [Bacteroidales bacterium]
MKILRLDFYRLRNEEWFQLFTEFRDLVLKYNPGALNKRYAGVLAQRTGKHPPRSAECFARPDTNE